MLLWCCPRAEHLNNHSKALHYYLKSLNIYRIIYGEDHPAAEAVCENLEALYKSLEKHQRVLICSNNNTLAVENLIFHEPPVEFRSITKAERSPSEEISRSSSVTEEENSENSSEEKQLLGKRSFDSPSPDNFGEGRFEPDVEKKIKQ